MLSLTICKIYEDCYIMQLIDQTSIQQDVPMAVTMSVEDNPLLLEDGNHSVDAAPEPLNDNNDETSSRPDSLSLDGWCVVSEKALTKEMLQHLSKPEEIASLAASYLTRQLFSLLKGTLDPELLDQIFKVLQEVSENDEKVLRNFITELNDEQDVEERPQPSDIDNEDRSDIDAKLCPRAIVKVLMDLLRFSPVPVEHNILWVRLLASLSHLPNDLMTFIDLKVAATVLGTMTVHVSSAEVQIAGCRVLEPLVRFKPTPEQKAPVRESGIQVLLRTFETHMASSAVVLAVCVVLANLTSTMSQFTSWVVQQGYLDEDVESLVTTSLSITDYIKEKGLLLLDRAGMLYQDNAQIQIQFYRIMACFGYHSPTPSTSSSLEDSPSPGKRKHSILKSPDSPRPSCTQRRVTFSYDLDTRVEYQCSDSDSDMGPDELKRHTVCGGETASAVVVRQSGFQDVDYKSRSNKGRVLDGGDRTLAFPNFEMEEDYLQMWQHILGDGLFSSICCDLAKLERDFDEMGSGSLNSGSGDSNETIDLLDYGTHVAPRPAKQPVEGPSKSIPPRREMRPGRGLARTRFATVPAYRYDFYQPNWQVQDTDEVVKKRLSVENCSTPQKTKIRPASEPPPRTDFILDESQDTIDPGDSDSDEKTFTEYSEIDLVEALVRSGRMNQENQPPIENGCPDEVRAEIENKGNEEKEKSDEKSTSERTRTQAESEDQSHYANCSYNSMDPFGLNADLLPIDAYLENRSLADDILSSFGIYENSIAGCNSPEPTVNRPYGTFTLSGVTHGSSETDAYCKGETVGDSQNDAKNPMLGSEKYDNLFPGEVSTTNEATQEAFAKVFETSCVLHPSLTPTSSISSASFSISEFSDLEALYEEEETTESTDSLTTQDTPPNSDPEMASSFHTIPKQRKLNFLHRFSERKAQAPPPPKPRRTWYYRSSADVRKSLVSSFAVDLDALGADARSTSLGRSKSRNSKRGLNLLAFSKANTNLSVDSGVVTGDDDDVSPTDSEQPVFPVEHEYEEVYRSRKEMKPTLYERISGKGHYADFKKANKVQVHEDNSSSEATYAVCTLWVNKHCVEALVTFDHLTKQLVSPYSILPAVRQLEGNRKSDLGTSLAEIESDYPAWTSILNVLATEESKWTLSLAAQVLPIIDRLFYTKDEAIMDASVALVQLILRKFGYEIEKHHAGGLFRTRFRDDCRTCFMWLSKLYSRVSDLLRRDLRCEEDLDSLLHLSLLNSLRESLKPYNGRVSRGIMF